MADGSVRPHASARTTALSIGTTTVHERRGNRAAFGSVGNVDHNLADLNASSLVFPCARATM